jgi:hypothetical protein
VYRIEGCMRSKINLKPKWNANKIFKERGLGE